MAERSFGISTRLFGDTPLTRDHLVHVAAHGFETIELYAARDHFDYRSPDAIAQLAEWLSDTQLRLHSVHAPVAAAIEEVEAAIGLARRIPFAVAVIHRPSSSTERTLTAMAGLAAALDVKVAVEARQHTGESVATLITLLDDDALEGLELGICLDFGHANLEGDVCEALEVGGGHLITTHVHDNGGRRDDRLVPYAGRIQWESAMMEVQKIGYDGALIFEYGPAADPVDVLARTMKARERLEKAFITF